MTAEHFSVGWANETGFVNRVYPAETLNTEVQRFAEQIAEQTPLAVQATKGPHRNAFGKYERFDPSPKSLTFL